MRSRAYISRIGIEGALLTLSPLPLLFLFTGTDSLLDIRQLLISFLAFVALWVCAFTLFRKPIIGQIFGIIAAIGVYGSAFSYILKNPFVALTATVLLISVTFSFIDFHIKFQIDRKSDHISRCRHRVWWGAMMVPVLVVTDLLLWPSQPLFSSVIISLSLVISLIMYMDWSLKSKSKTRIFLNSTVFLLIVFLYVVSLTNLLPSMAMLWSLGVLISFPREKETFEKKEHWWEILLSHPARVMLTTFLSLCVLGTFLLLMPASTHHGAIKMVDAAFTSVSAVCVTGLIVLDTPNDFTILGQLCILLLIQLGGLGIMSIATVALQAIGRRISLKQERLLTSMTDTDHQDLVHSLKTILKFTFIAESIGTAILIFLFHAAGDSIKQASWRGLFTAISAFCNAGFSLQSDSLVPYQTNALILHTVAALIVFGGMAPATSLLIPKWISRKPTPIPARIALVTTVILLISGTFFIMAFEWNGILAGLSVIDKIQNAWFQSVTLRTAGFNSVGIATIASPTFLLMIAFMFIGGSPGGTAGGVKTTTIGILAMTLWANIANRNDVVIQNRRIYFTSIYRAITIFGSGIVVWFLIVLMLQVTQQISTRDLIFEATSALGTVGLSIGATPLLDEIGKVIIIIAMFVGRIGPITLFMLLSNEYAVSDSRCPEEKISLS